MTKVQKALLVVLIVLAVLLISYLLRTVSIPPDCMNQPEAPACQGPK